MGLKFRAATLDDVDTIVALADEIWHQHYPLIISADQIEFMLSSRYSPPAIKKQFATGEKFFLAIDEDQPRAYASFELKNDTYFIHKFYVDTAMHRKGIGTAFFHFLLEQMKPHYSIRLQVNRKNIKAINFYFKHGFIIERVGDFDIGGGYYMNDFVMLRQPAD